MSDVGKMSIIMETGRELAALTRRETAAALDVRSIDVSDDIFRSVRRDEDRVLLGKYQGPMFPRDLTESLLEGEGPLSVHVCQDLVSMTPSVRPTKPTQ